MKKTSMLVASATLSLTLTLTGCGNNNAGGCEHF